jgi:hypothetical protein
VRYRIEVEANNQAYATDFFDIVVKAK